MLIDKNNNSSLQLRKMNINSEIFTDKEKENWLKKGPILP